MAQVLLHVLTLLKLLLHLLLLSEGLIVVGLLPLRVNLMHLVDEILSQSFICFFYKDNYLEIFIYCLELVGMALEGSREIAHRGLARR